MLIINGIESEQAILSALSSVSSNADTAAEEATELAKHFHGNEIWFGDSTTPDPGVHEATVGSLTTFQVDSGDNAWGTAIQILGTSDTPVGSGMTKYDLHKILVTTTERTSVISYMRITFGTSEAQGILDGNSTMIALFPTATIRMNAVPFMAKRAPAGSKAWANAKVAGDTGTINFIFGLHEYLV